MRKLNVLGIMAGNGVCLYPFRKYFNIMGNYELRGVFYDKDQEQWKANFPNVEQNRHPRRYKKRVDVIIGHPDCGDSSVLRMSRAKKAGSVKDNESITEFIQSIVEYNPDFWLMENLPGLLKTFDREYFEEKFPNYHIIIHEASVAHFGNSQISRKRLVIIGLSKKYPVKACKYFRLPQIDYSKLSFSQDFELGEKDNPNICHVREDLHKTANLYYLEQRKIPYAKAHILWNTKFKGQARWHVGGKMNNQPGVSRNLPDSFPLTVRKQNRQFGTQGLVLSPREMANIQGVPKSYKLVYKKGQKNYWINKGRLTVTKTMPYEIGRWFANKVFRLVNDTSNDTI